MSALLRRIPAAIALLLVGALPIAREAAAQGAPPGGDHPPHTEGMGLDRTIRTFLLTELLETAPNVPGRPIRLDGTGWIGGDYNRVWLNLDAEQPTSGRELDIRGDVNYGRLVSPFWNALAGVRVEGRRREVGPARTRALLHLGLEGLSPYWFTMEPSLYVSPRGDISARLATTYDLLLTQRLVLQPRLETHAAVQRVPEFGIAPGVNDVELGARVRYEIRREFAPYVGVYWYRRTGGAAAMAREAGEGVRERGVVAGLRVWR